MQSKLEPLEMNPPPFQERYINEICCLPGTELLCGDVRPIVSLFVHQARVCTVEPQLSTSKLAQSLSKCDMHAAAQFEYKMRLLSLCGKRSLIFENEQEIDLCYNTVLERVGTGAGS
jgi:hypothetical protein